MLKTLYRINWMIDDGTIDRIFVFDGWLGTFTQKINELFEDKVKVHVIKNNIHEVEGKHFGKHDCILFYETIIKDYGEAKKYILKQAIANGAFVKVLTEDIFSETLQSLQSKDENENDKNSMDITLTDIKYDWITQNVYRADGEHTERTLQRYIVLFLINENIESKIDIYTQQELSIEEIKVKIKETLGENNMFDIFKRKELSELKSSSTLITDIQPIYAIDEYKEAWRKLKEKGVQEDNKDLLKAIAEIEIDMYKQHTDYMKANEDLSDDEAKKIKDVFFKRYAR